ncbi:hypothetical protein ABZ128_27780 [Streptomyces sp. NPDC006326]
MPDPRVEEITALLRQGQLTTTEVAERFGVGERTAQRLLAVARMLPAT